MSISGDSSVNSQTAERGEQMENVGHALRKEVRRFIHTSFNNTKYSEYRLS